MVHFDTLPQVRTDAAPPANAQANAIHCETHARALALALGVTRDHGIAARVVATPCGRWRVEAVEAVNPT